MDGTTTARAATLLADLVVVSDTYAWAARLLEAHTAARALQSSFSGPELHTISRIAPDYLVCRGPWIYGDGSSPRL
jgi:hypothetical protein